MRRYLPAFQQSPLVFATTKATGIRWPSLLTSNPLAFFSESALRFI
jgi:hypothetical protein